MHARAAIPVRSQRDLAAADLGVPHDSVGPPAGLHPHLRHARGRGSAACGACPRSRSATLCMSGLSDCGAVAGPLGLDRATDTCPVGMAAALRVGLAIPNFGIPGAHAPRAGGRRRLHASPPTACCNRATRPAAACGARRGAGGAPSVRGRVPMREPPHRRLDARLVSSPATAPLTRRGLGGRGCTPREAPAQTGIVHLGLGAFHRAQPGDVAPPWRWSTSRRRGGSPASPGAAPPRRRRAARPGRAARDPRAQGRAARATRSSCRRALGGGRRDLERRRAALRAGRAAPAARHALTDQITSACSPARGRIAEAVGRPAIRAAAGARAPRGPLPTLAAPPDLDVAAYVEQLFGRFANAALEHQGCQVASDGSLKLPVRTDLNRWYGGACARIRRARRRRHRPRRAGRNDRALGGRRRAADHAAAARRAH